MCRVIALIACLLLLCGTSYAADIGTFITEGSNTPSIRIQGRIEPPDVAEFERQARAAHEKYSMPYMYITVWLDSGGGNVGALDIGTIIARRGMQTFVPAGKHCYSLCAYIWLAGSQRWLGKKAEIGFHMAHAIPGAKVSRDEYMAVNAEIGRYFGTLGMSSDFLEWVIAAGSNVHILTPRDAQSFHIQYKEVS